MLDILKESATSMRNSFTEVYIQSIDRQIERSKEAQQEITKQLDKNKTWKSQTL